MAFTQKKIEEQVMVPSERETEDAAIIGSEDGLSEVLELVELAASSDAPVLITGETGTGKNLVAKAIHARSAAKRGPFT